MPEPADLTRAETHFAFGRNWAAYAQKIAQPQIDEAVRGLQRLVPRLDGARFLDIGCGSGLHSLAALRLGAAEVVGIDIDADSVDTAAAVLARHAPGARVRMERQSIFDVSPDSHGRFDVVYSWGVLHHTGDMYRALRCAAGLVNPGGSLVVALYRKTWSCGLWRLEKRWYTGASERAQSRARALYARLFALTLRLRGRRLEEHVRDYRSSRGMDFFHDVHDWLGGYPYESIAPGELDGCMAGAGFERGRAFVEKGRIFGRHSGILGSGCDEYVYTRKSDP
jgi:2-polyprenyl-6-hydroxyphenyl methylase/3-demethylubiquinone-9 3-methyltransferase